MKNISDIKAAKAILKSYQKGRNGPLLQSERACLMRIAISMGKTNERNNWGIELSPYIRTLLGISGNYLQAYGQGFNLAMETLEPSEN